MPGPRVLPLLTFLIVAWSPVTASKEMGSERLQKVSDAGANSCQTSHEQRDHPVRETTVGNGKAPPKLLAVEDPSAARGRWHRTSAMVMSRCKVTRRPLPGGLSTLLKLNHNRAAAIVKKSSPGSKVSLSLDVPLHILRVLLEEAKVKDMQAKAAANAELMARIGRRK